MRSPAFAKGDSTEFRAFVAPIQSGKTDDWKELVREITGPRREEELASLRRMGVTRERIFLQHTPNGDAAIVCLEGEDIASGITSSPDVPPSARPPGTAGA